MLEPAIVTVHAAGGRAMMEDAKAAAGLHTKVVAVTVLTSLDEDDLTASAYPATPHPGRRLADLAQEAGLDGIVCSGQKSKHACKLERRLLRRPRPAPGRCRHGRPETHRHATATRDDGASVLVIGRPITRPRPRRCGAGDRGDALKR